MSGKTVQAIVNTLKGRGEKITPARKGILEVLASTDQLLNVAEIYEALRTNGVFVNYSTVYRTLDYLSKNNLIEKLVVTGENKYKLLKHREHIHHLICKKCHSTQPFDYCPYDDLKDIIKAKTNFLPLEHRLEIYGYCEECQKKHNSNYK
ncbi:MAG TPA: transcriptional repressor [Clostridia bacterium]|jgi:Fe2+ or Zn2+ uptake regulation protein|nr:transcriptional repressor [Clostridia bacterium]